jgi:hypothetical protein
MPDSVCATGFDGGALPMRGQIRSADFRRVIDRTRKRFILLD